MVVVAFVDEASLCFTFTAFGAHGVVKGCAFVANMRIIVGARSLVFQLTPVIWEATHYSKILLFPKFQATQSFTINFFLREGSTSHTSGSITPGSVEEAHVHVVGEFVPGAEGAHGDVLRGTPRREPSIGSSAARQGVVHVTLTLNESAYEQNHPTAKWRPLMLKHCK